MPLDDMSPDEHPWLYRYTQKTYSSGLAGVGCLIWLARGASSPDTVSKIPANVQARKGSKTTRACTILMLMLFFAMNTCSLNVSDLDIAISILLQKMYYLVLMPPYCRPHHPFLSHYPTTFPFPSPPTWIFPPPTLGIAVLNGSSHVFFLNVRFKTHWSTT